MQSTFWASPFATPLDPDLEKGSFVSFGSSFLLVKSGAGSGLGFLSSFVFLSSLVFCMTGSFCLDEEAVLLEVTPGLRYKDISEEENTTPARTTLP